MAGQRVTEAELDQRVGEVYTLILKGGSRSDILQYIAKKEWDISPRQADEYIKKAKALFRKQAARNQQGEFGKALERNNYIFRQAVLIQDWQRALAAQKEISNLLGLYPSTKHEHSGSISLTLEQLAALPEDELKKIAGGH